MLLAESGDAGFTDWDQAKKQIEDRLKKDRTKRW
jgi:hypothetical protein